MNCKKLNRSSHIDRVVGKVFTLKVSKIFSDWNFSLIYNNVSDFNDCDLKLYYSWHLYFHFDFIIEQMWTFINRFVWPGLSKGEIRPKSVKIKGHLKIFLQTTSSVVRLNNFDRSQKNIYASSTVVHWPTNDWHQLGLECCNKIKIYEKWQSWHAVVQRLSNLNKKLNPLFKVYIEVVNQHVFFYL